METPRKTARQLLERKQTGIVAVAPEDTVLAALKVMAEKNVGAVLVLEGERLAGILSERDYARKVELQGRSAAQTRVREIMTAEVFSVSPGALVESCNRLMSDKRVRHLPVLDGDRIVGVLSNRDVLEEVIAEDEQRIRGLETERLITTTDPGTY
jgi:CBS domain-containing protein